MEKVLFARIGYMKHYQGPQTDDEWVLGGGSYNDDGLGDEAYNYLNIDGNVYGFFQPYSRKERTYELYKLNLKRIAPTNANSDKIKNVLVIFFSKVPDGEGQVIIGWYRNATVYRNLQDSEYSERNYIKYYLSAQASDAVLLPPNERRYPIGHNISGLRRGNPGQANVFYIYESSRRLRDFSLKKYKWIPKAIEYVKSCDSSTELSPGRATNVDSIRKKLGRPYQTDQKTKKTVECYAMSVAEKHYRKRGYQVKDKHKNYPYDLLIKKGETEKMVEVKGLQGEPDRINLTKNEVKYSLQYDNMELFILHSIVVDKKTGKASKGVKKIISPWKVNEEKLTPTQYSYDLD